MFSTLHDHSKYCMNIIHYLVVSYIHPLPLKLFAYINFPSLSSICWMTDLHIYVSLGWKELIVWIVRLHLCQWCLCLYVLCYKVIYMTIMNIRAWPHCMADIFWPSTILWNCEWTVSHAYNNAGDKTILTVKWSELHFAVWTMVYEPSYKDVGPKIQTTVSLLIKLWNISAHCQPWASMRDLLIIWICSFHQGHCIPRPNFCSLLFQEDGER